MHQRMVAAVASAVESLNEGVKVNVTQLSRGLGVTPKTFYKWAKRYEKEGLPGLEELSRRPLHSPGRLAPFIEDAIVEWRKRLEEQGLDAGAATIRWHLTRKGTVCPPSEATIWRVLTRRGCIVPQPRKRPKSALRRFAAARPNEWWQIDHFDWALADETPVKIFNGLDDHSRLAPFSRAVMEATTEAAWQAFRQGISEYGVPAGCLSDNGLCFSGKLRGFEVYFEIQLRAAGIRAITARPFHPQTCGKVERFQQTLKKWLSRQPRADTIEALQAQLDSFRHYYNHERPHRGIGGRTPWECFSATPPAMAAPGPLEGPEQRRRINVSASGLIECRPWRIKVPIHCAGAQAEVYLSATRASVFIEGRLVRDFELDQSQPYQGLSRSLPALGDHPPSYRFLRARTSGAQPGVKLERPQRSEDERA